LVVKIVKGVDLMPGDTFPYEALGVFLTAVFVKSQVTGNEKVAPCARAPFGRVALSMWKFWSPIVAPMMDVIATTAVQFTVSVWLLPRATFPKLTGEEQLRGKLTGEPRQYRTPFASVVYSRVSPNAGRWNLFAPPI